MEPPRNKNKTTNFALLFLTFLKMLIEFLKYTCAALTVASFVYYWVAAPDETVWWRMTVVFVGILALGLLVFRYLYYLGGKCRSAIIKVRLANDIWERPQRPPVE